MAGQSKETQISTQAKNQNTEEVAWCVEECKQWTGEPWLHSHGSAESQQEELIQYHKSDSKEAPVHTCAVSLIFERMLYDNVQVREGIPST